MTTRGAEHENQTNGVIGEVGDTLAHLFAVAGNPVTLVFAGKSRPTKSI